MLASLADLTEELAGLEFVHARELEREVREGACHAGLASVVQAVGARRHEGQGGGAKAEPAGA